MDDIINKLNSKYEPSSFSDKLLGKDIGRRLQQLIKKDLTRDDLLELLYLLTSDELKLANLSEYDRYILGKYFTWVRDLVKLGEFYYDLLETDDIKDKKVKEVLRTTKDMVLHNIKFSVDIYLYLLRSTLGVEAFAFDSMSKSRYEYEYGGATPTSLTPPDNKKLSFFKR